MISKMKVIGVIAVFVLILLALPLVIAEQVTEPTQQFNKIFLDPFYRQSMDPGNYTYNLSFNPPDGVSSIKSAIVTFQLWLNPTVSFNIWVNDIPCNTENFEVHTTYAGAGEGTIFFDCSNIIKESGNYTITLQPDDDTGAITGWADITYMNNPEGSINIFGTEYRPGERARVFLQLKDNQGNPEDNGDCNLYAYYPNQINASAEVLIDNAPMLHLDGSQGVYYYDIATLPNATGVYMMTAGCNYELSSAFVYYSDGTDSNAPKRYNTTGTYSSSTVVLNAYTDYAYTKCVGAGGATKYCIATYDFDTTIHFNSTENLTDLNLFYMGEASYPAFQYFEVYNYTGSSWYRLTNNLTFSGVSPTNPIGLNDFVSNHIPTPYDFIDNTSGNITVRITTSAGSTFQVYHNWLNINLKTASGVVQDLKGSGEMHVHDWFDYYRQSYTDSTWTNFTGNITTNILNQTGNASAYHVWNYSENINTNILNQTGNASANYVWNYSGTINSNIINQVVEAIWAYTDTINGNITYQFAETMWNWTGTISTVITGNVSDAVWTRTHRNLTWYNMTDTTNYTKINDEVPQYVWNYTTREVTGGNVSIDTSNISSSVWNYSDRTMTAGTGQSWVGGTEYTAQESVGRIVARVLDNANEPVNGGTCTIVIFYPTNVSIYINDTMTHNATQQQGIYYYDFNQSGEVGVHTYVIDCYKGGQDFYLMGTYHVQDINRTKTVEEVWSYDNRSLTNYTVDINNTAIADTIWSSSNRTLTNYSEDSIASRVWSDDNRSLTNYSQEGLVSEIWSYAGAISPTIIGNFSEGIWTFSVRNLTYYNMTDTTNYTKIPQYVWTYTFRNLTDYGALATDVWNFTGNISSVIIDDVSGGVWTYTTRNLTYYNMTDTTNYTNIPIVVWQYGNRSLTNYSTDIAGIWSYNNRSLTNYSFEGLTADIVKAVWNHTGNFSNNILGNISEGVWTFSIRNLTYYNMTDTTNYTKINKEVPALVWTYTFRNLTDYGTIPQEVWNYSNRSLTNYTTDVDAIWSYSNRSLTNYTVDINNTAIAEAVWAYSGTIGANVLSQIAQEIWEYAGTPVASLLNNISSNTWNFSVRNLTWYNMTDTTNYTKINDEIPGLVWTYENRTVTAGNVSISGNVTIDASQVWDYNGNINSNITGQFVNDTWNYTARYTHGEIV